MAGLVSASPIKFTRRWIGTRSQSGEEWDGRRNAGKSSSRAIHFAVSAGGPSERLPSIISPVEYFSRVVNGQRISHFRLVIVVTMCLVLAKRQWECSFMVNRRARIASPISEICSRSGRRTPVRSSKCCSGPLTKFGECLDSMHLRSRQGRLSATFQLYG
jgi:hypothetical protein